MKTHSGVLKSRFLLITVLLLVGVLTVPATASAACYNGRCPVGEYDENESQVEVTITVSVSPEDSGRIELNGVPLESSSFVVIQGTEVTLEVEEDSGWEFESWSGSMSSTDNPWTTPFYNNKTLVANLSRSSSVEEEEEGNDGDGVDFGISVDIDDSEALDADGEPFDVVEIDVRSAHDAPADSLIVSSVFDLGPDGAEFDPPAPLSIEYSRSQLPVGVDESDLVIAYFDDDTGEWLALDSVVDEEAGVVETEVSHFTEFCLLAPEPGPEVAALFAPGFSFSELVVPPDGAQVGQPLSVAVTVSYSGSEASATSQVQLLLDGEVAATQSITLSSGEFRVMELTFVPEEDGAHLVDVKGLQGTVDVAPATAPTVLSEAMNRAEKDTFEAPAFSLPALPELPGVPSLSLPSLPASWNWHLGAVIAGGVLALLLLLPLLRRKMLRYRYDI